ncbi:MAG: preprotein translocase subunit SecG [Treponema sp.]|nr:preprotein translocase subunit SecG [Treponema sp.]
MGVVRTILLVAFVIICVLLVLLILVQNEKDNGMGSMLGGGQSAAFGAHSASVVSRTTGVLVALFFVTTFVLALLNKAPSKDGGLRATAAEVQGLDISAESEASGTTSWLEEELHAASEPEAPVESSGE